MKRPDIRQLLKSQSIAPLLFSRAISSITSEQTRIDRMLVFRDETVYASARKLGNRHGWL
jgi:hypothetical protein